MHGFRRLGTFVCLALLGVCFATWAIAETDRSDAAVELDAERSKYPVHLSGEWLDDLFGNVDWNASVVLDGNTFRGQVLLPSEPDLGILEIDGTVSGSDLTVIIRSSDVKLLHFSGSYDGRTISGSYDLATGGFSGSTTWSFRSDSSSPDVH
mgnify:CR=1 FL=1